MVTVLRFRYGSRTDEPSSARSSGRWRVMTARTTADSRRKIQRMTTECHRRATNPPAMSDRSMADPSCRTVLDLPKWTARTVTTKTTWMTFEVRIQKKWQKKWMVNRTAYSARHGCVHEDDLTVRHRCWADCISQNTVGLTALLKSSPGVIPPLTAATVSKTLLLEIWRWIRWTSCCIVSYSCSQIPET
jgi:hypothetical protein